jgi:hypothetical protein
MPDLKQVTSHPLRGLSSLTAQAALEPTAIEPTALQRDLIEQHLSDGVQALVRGQPSSIVAWKA